MESSAGDSSKASRRTLDDFFRLISEKDGGMLSGILRSPKAVNRTGVKMTGKQGTQDMNTPSGPYTNLCSKCKVYKKDDEVYKTGRDKSQIKCKGCTRVTDRMKYIKENSGLVFAKEWDCMDKGCLAAFMEAANELYESDLAEAMTLTVQLKMIERSTVFSGGLGQYWPENYYLEVMRFTEEQVTNLKKNCPSKFDEQLGCHTFCYEVLQEGWKDEKITEIQATWEPRGERKHADPQFRSATSGDVPSSLPAALSSAGSMPARAEADAALPEGQYGQASEVQSDNASMCGHTPGLHVGGQGPPQGGQPGGQQVKKRRKDEEEKKREAEQKKEEQRVKKESKDLKKNANTMVGDLGHIVVRLHTLLYTKITPDVKRLMPSYIIDSASQSHAKLTNMDAAWKRVLSGQQLPSDVFDFEADKRVVEQATSTANDVEVMVGIAAKQVHP